MPDPVIDRALPHNLEAERSVLGAILIRNDALNHATEIIDAPDFFRDAHRVIFETMIALNEDGHAIDLVTLKDGLARRGKLDAVGGAAYIASLVDGVPRAMHVDQYARIIKEKSVLRQLGGVAEKIHRSVMLQELDADDLLDEAEREVFAIADRSLRTGFVSLSTLVHDSVATIERLQEHKQLITGIPTGFRELDEMTSGLQRSDLVIVAARPSMGKTSFTLNIALHAGLAGMTVGVFSLEMSKDQLFMRLLSSEARIDLSRLRTGHLLDKDYSRLGPALGRLDEARVFIDDSPGVGVLEMRAKSRRLKAEHGLDLLIVDYVQLMQARGRFDNRQQELASISRALKGLAKELNVPIIALSQLSRAPDARADHRPQLSDLRESGALEQDADVVMFIYREEQYERTEENEGIADIIIGKQRNGPTGDVRLAFIKQFTRFENLEWQRS
ncbi:MAG: replicative DNA helicase [Vicinamibacteraceae bacterium]|nr:replicative DNA helicase [Vicinamibacteraceae bacterium]